MNLLNWGGGFQAPVPVPVPVDLDLPGGVDPKIVQHTGPILRFVWNLGFVKKNYLK